jgi:hypothetical protein
MRHRAWWVLVLTVSMMTAGGVAYGQNATSSAPLSGNVIDTSGAVVPGANVLVKNNATGNQSEAVTGADGRFTVPALNPGIYTVTISLIGFRTWSSPDVTMVAALPANIKAQLEVGKLEETVVVTGATEIVQTQTTTVATTLGANQISNLPLVTRNAVDFMTHLPGVDTTGTIRSNTSVLGLNMNAMNIVIDGVNVQDNYLKSTDGFFAVVRPTLDAVEEVTMTMAAQDAASAGQGAVQMRFVTRSGTIKFQGSVYNTLRNPSFNSAYYFNKRDLPRQADGKAFVDQVRVTKYGFREGGPITIPGLFDGRDKAFFFFNYENSIQPSTSARNRTAFNPTMLTGVYQYNTSSGVKSVDLLALAAKNGQIAAMDPTVAKLLADIEASTHTTGGLTQLSDPNLRRFTFSNNMNDTFGGPTVRLDVNLTSRHRLGGSFYLQKYVRDPDMLNSYDPAFPGFPVVGTMHRTNTVTSINLRSTFSSNIVNEGKFGSTGGATKFAPEISRGQYTGQLANMGGYALNLNGAAGLSNAYCCNFNSTRNSPVWSVEDTLNWIHGSHSVSMGGSFTNIMLDLMDVNRVVPRINFGLDANDPAQTTMFTSASVAANFPGIGTTDLSNAKAIYALLTGRVTGIDGDAYLNTNGQYQYNGPLMQQARMRELGFFAQDSWRLRPYMTLTAGLRYEVQLPFTPVSPVFSVPSSPDDLFGISGPGNLFVPGAKAGKTPTFVAFTKGMPAYKTDLNNFAPSAGVALRPTVQGWLKKILGTDPVFRGGYSLAYMREGTASFINMFSSNPGGTISATRNMTLGNLVTNTGTDVLPVLLKDKSRLGPAVFAQTPRYPLTGATTDQLNVFDPNTTVPYTHSWSFGFQRALDKNTAIEVRYVGTRSRDGWAYNNWNEVNIKENGFLNEFKLAMANLQANIGAGRGTNFKYYGPGTGTSPLPIYLAYFSGVPASQAGDPSKYTSSLFSNSNFYNPLNPVNPNPSNPASGNSNYGLYGDATRRANALAAGLPPNEFVVNPDLLGGAYQTYNRNFTGYDSGQFLMRRRMSAGLLFETSYAFGRGTRSSWYTLRQDPESVVNTSVPRHVFKANWVWELPFGQGKRWGGGVGRGMNRLIGGWSFDGGGRIQSGTIADLGNVRLVNMTDADLQRIYQLQFRPDAISGKTLIYMWPQDVIDNTIKAYSYGASGYTKGAPTGRYFAPANGPDCIQVVSGDCAPRHHYVSGPIFTRFDMSVAKRIAITNRASFDLRLEVLNVFDNINFNQTVYPTGSSSSPYTQTTSWEVTSAYKDINNTQDPGGRLLQIVSRISW